MTLLRDASNFVQDAHGKYVEACYRDKLFSACQTVPTTMPAGLSASPTTTTLYNPIGSGVDAFIVYAGVTNIVAFPAAAIIWLGINDNLAAAAVSGSALTIKPSKFGGGNVSKLLAFTTATLPAAPTIAAAILGAGLTGAITLLPSVMPVGRFFDGQIGLLPGAAISFQSSTVGGTNGSAGEFIWEELPRVV